MRIFFHVEYKTETSGRKINSDELPSLEKQLGAIQEQIDLISDEIEHSRKQEATLQEAGGN